MHNLFPLRRTEEALKRLLQHLLHLIAEHPGQRIINVFANEVLCNEDSILQIVNQLAVFFL
ncbi:hypothetical protein D3C80_2208040 [compost metagenome]